MNFIYHGAKRAEKTRSYGSKCYFTLRKTYNLSCACLNTKKMKVATVIHMDEVYTNWKRLWFDDDDGVMKDDKPNISIMTE